MADAKKCDRCGKFYFLKDEIWGNRPIHEGRDIYYLTACSAGGTIIDVYDLCADCAVEFENFIKNKNRV